MWPGESLCVNPTRIRYQVANLGGAALPCHAPHVMRCIFPQALSFKIMAYSQNSCAYIIRFNQLDKIWGIRSDTELFIWAITSV